MTNPHADFERLYMQYAGFVQMRISILVHQPDIVEDLCQETFLKAWRAFPRLQHDSNLSAWLWTIATNTVRDYIRHSKLQTAVSYEALIESGWDAEACQPDVADSLAQAEMRRRALARIANAHRRNLRALAADPTYWNKGIYHARRAYHAAMTALEQEVAS